MSLEGCHENSLRNGTTTITRSWFTFLHTLDFSFRSNLSLPGQLNIKPLSDTMKFKFIITTYLAPSAANGQTFDFFPFHLSSGHGGSSAKIAVEELFQHE